MKDSIKSMDDLKEQFKTLLPEHLDAAILRMMKDLQGMSIEEREAAGYTRDLWLEFREFAVQIREGERSMKEFQDIVNKDRGREQLVKSVNNIMTAISKLANTIIGPFNKAFHLTEDGVASFADGLEFVTSKLIISDKAADFLTKCFTKLFAITKNIGSYISKILTSAFDKLSVIFENVKKPGGEFVSNMYAEFLKLDSLQKLISKVRKLLENSFGKLKDAFSNLLTSLSSINWNTISPDDLLKVLATFASNVQKAFDGIFDLIVSPFTKGIDDVGVVMDEFVSVLDEKYEVVVTVVKKIGTFLKKFLGDNIGAVLASAGMLTLMKVINNISNTVRAVTDNLPSNKIVYTIGEFLTSISKSFTKLSNAKAFEANANALKSLSIAVAIMAASILAIAHFGKDHMSEIVQAAIVVGVIVTVLTIIVIVMGNLPSPNVVSKAVTSVSALSVMSGAAILLLSIAGSIYWLSTIDADALIRARNTILILVGVIFVLMIVIKAIESTGIAKAKANVVASTISVAGIGFALLLMAASLYLLTKIPASEMELAMDNLTGLVILLGVLIATVGKVGAKSSAGAVGAFALTASLLILVMLFDYMIKTELYKKTDELWATFWSLIPIMLLIGVLLALTHLGGQNALKAGGSLILISIAMLIMVGIMHLLSELTPKELAKGLISLTLMMFVIGLIIGLSALAGQWSGKAGLMLLGVAAVLLVMTFIIMILSVMKPEKLIPGMICLGLMTLMIGILIAVSKDAGEASTTSKTLTAALALLVVIILGLAILSACDPVGLIVGAVAVGILLGALAVALKVISNCKKEISTKTLVALTVLTVVLTALTFMIAILSTCDPVGAIAGAYSLSVLLLAMTGSLAIISKMGQRAKGLKNGISAMAQLTVIVIVLSVIIYMLSKADPLGAVASAVALSILLMALSTCALIISKIKVDIKALLLASLALAILAIVVGGLAFIISKLSESDPTSVIASATALALLLTVLTACTVILGVLGIVMASTGGLALLGVAAIALLALVCWLIVETVIEPLVAMNQGSLMSSVIALGILLMYMSVALIILSVVGLAGPAALIGIAMLVAVMAAVIGLGYLFQEFTSLQGYMDAGMAAIKALAKGMGEALGAFISAISDSIANSIPKIGQAMTDFMDNMQGFIDGAKTIRPGMFDGVYDMIAAMGAIIALDVASFLADFLTFGSEGVDLEKSMGDLGKAVNAFDKGCGKIDASTIKQKTEAANILMAAVAKMPRSGGLMGKLLGENEDLGGFSENIESFGGAIKAFEESVKDLKVSTVEKGADAGLKLMEMAKNAPNEGGMLGFFMGENGLGSFSTHITDFGTAISKFSGEVKDVVLSDVENAASAGAALITMATGIPNEGGILGDLMGENGLGDFSTHIVTFGEAIRDFSGIVGGIAPSTMGMAISNAAGLMIALQEIPVDEDGEFNADMVTDFGDALVKLAEDLVEVNGTLDDVSSENLSAITSKFKEIGSVFGTLDEATVTNISQMGTAISELATFSAYDFINGFSDEKVIENINTALNIFQSNMLYGLYNDEIGLLYQDAGNAIYESIIEGLLSGLVNIITDLEPLTSGIIDEVDGQYSKAWSAGFHISQGVANGIAGGKYLAITQATKLAEETLAAIKEGLKEESPSKATTEMGVYLDAGLANGMNNGTKTVLKSADNLTYAVKQRLLSNVHKIVEMIENGVDTEPVIRPVMDLSNITQGIGTMNSSISGMKINDINARMNYSGTQNGADSRASSSTVSYVQNNYSPKALSQVEIYRQTKNLIATAKG